MALPACPWRASYVLTLLGRQSCMSLRVWGPYSDPTMPVTHLELCTTPWKSESPAWAFSSAGTNVHMLGAYERQKDCLRRQANWECDPLSRTGLFPVDQNMFGSFSPFWCSPFLSFPNFHIRNHLLYRHFFGGPHHATV